MLHIFLDLTYFVTQKFRHGVSSKFNIDTPKNSNPNICRNKLDLEVTFRLITKVAILLLNG